MHRRISRDNGDTIAASHAPLQQRIRNAAAAIIQLTKGQPIGLE
jgi:hypothetical protein